MHDVAHRERLHLTLDLNQQPSLIVDPYREAFYDVVGLLDADLLADRGEGPYVLVA
jgi:hypothetical protein